MGIESTSRPWRRHWGFDSWNHFFDPAFKRRRAPGRSPDDDKVIVSASEATPYGIEQTLKAKTVSGSRASRITQRHAGRRRFRGIHPFGGTIYQAISQRDQLSPLWQSPVGGDHRRGHSVQESTNHSRGRLRGSRCCRAHELVVLNLGTCRGTGQAVAAQDLAEPAVTPEIKARLLTELERVRLSESFVRTNKRTGAVTERTALEGTIGQHKNRTVAVAAIIAADGTVSFISAHFDEGHTEHAEPQLLTKIEGQVSVGPLLLSPSTRFRADPATRTASLLSSNLETTRIMVVSECSPFAPGQRCPAQRDAWDRRPARVGLAQDGCTSQSGKPFPRGR